MHAFRRLLSSLTSAFATRRAFSLLEMSVVLAILALVMVMVVQLSGDSEEAADIATMIEKPVGDPVFNRVKTIQEAVEAYRAQNGSYPCPADPALPAGHANYGKSASGCSGGSITDTGSVLVGAVPFRTLGLTEEYAADKWENKYTFAVTKALSTGNEKTFNEAEGAVTVQTRLDDGTMGAVTDKAAYIVLSHGKDQRGARRAKSGATAAACGSSKLDSHNCIDGTPDAVFVDDSFNPGSQDADHFDDYVMWAEKKAPSAANLKMTGDPCTPPWSGANISHGGTVTAFQAATVPCGSTCTSQTRTCNDGSLSGSYTNKTCTVGACASCSGAISWGAGCSGTLATLAHGASSTVTNTAASYTGNVTITCNNGTSNQSAPSCSIVGCSLPWGGSIANGASVTAYQTSSVACGSTCTSQTRTCTAGVLSGSYTNASCSVTACASCSLPWGGTLSHGNSTTAYSTSSVACGSSCPAGTTRTCNDGTLSGSGDHASCSVAACASCTLPWGGSIAHGASASAYSVSSVTCPATCPAATTRTCTNGTLSGSGDYASCSAGACASCSSPCGTISHGGTCTAYQNASEPCGGSCTSQTRTCTNGTLSGSYSNASCSVAACASCTLPWGGSIAHGASASAYSVSSVTCPATCPAATTRTCTNGTLSGSGNFASCSAGACASCASPCGTIAHGATCTAWNVASSCGGCASETRTCTNGTLSGSYGNASCNNSSCASCSLPWGGSIGHGASTTSYSTGSVACGSSCPAGTTRTCTNGSLSGSGDYGSCSVAACASCSLPWGGSIAHGASATAWNVASSCGSCASETRTCSNGTLSGSYGNASCNNGDCGGGDPCFDAGMGCGCLLSGPFYGAGCIGTDIGGGVCCAGCSSCGDGGGGGCFAGDTAVLMADGTTRAIKDIKRGDKVMAFDNQSAGTPLVARKVNATIAFEQMPVLRINQHLVVSYDHKFPTPKKNGVKAGDMRVGDTLYAQDGSEMRIDSIEWNYGTIPVYNIEVDGLNTYVAGGVRTNNMLILRSTIDQLKREGRYQIDGANKEIN